MGANPIEKDYFKYLDVNLPIDERIEDLVSCMTLEEKVSQMTHTSKGISRLGISDYNWWNEENQYYQIFWTEDRTFHRGEGVPFLLWFNVTDNKVRINATVKDILSKEWNVENLSAFPALLYCLGYDEEAYRYLVSLPTMNRSEYPEVSYGVIEGCVGGLMGIKPAVGNVLSTCSHTNSDVEVKIENLPLWDGYVTVQHSGNKFTHLKNNTGRKLTWNVSFIGEYSKIEVNGIDFKPIKSEDSKGNIISIAIFEFENNNEACI